MRIGIIGGGIIGLCTAYYLLDKGHEITIIDQGNLEDGTSFGNAGMIVPSHVVPLASPGVISKGIRWMFNAKSPFYIHPRFDKDLVRWGALFRRSATADHVKHAVPLLRDISWLSQKLYKKMAEEVNFSFGLSHKGLLMLYQSRSAEKEEKKTAQIANDTGVEAQILSAEEIQKMEPEVKVNVRGGIYFPGDSHLTPPQLMSGLVKYLQDREVKLLLKTPVTDFLVKGNEIRKVVTGDKRFSFDEVILACGSWSPLLLKKLYFHLPLQPGKGYSFDLKSVSRNIHIPSLLIDGKVAMTPMGTSLRCSGTMEISGLGNDINMEKVKGIVHTVNRFYPEMKVKLPSKKEVWSGLRPCSPDGLPFIGRLKHIDNAIVAAGHSMMGMSLGPATGKLVSELALGENMDMDISAFSPVRFERKLYSRRISYS